MKTQLMLAALMQAMVLGAAGASPTLPYQTIEVHNGDGAGPYSENERTGKTITRNNNNQVGAGYEHVRCTLLKGPNDTNSRILCVGTGSYTINGVPVSNTLQGLCYSFEVTPTGISAPIARYFTNNATNSGNRRHAMDPMPIPVFGTGNGPGQMALTLYQYRPNGANNTKLYGVVLDSQCNEVAGGAQKELFAVTNDNVLGTAQTMTDAASNILGSTATATTAAYCGIGNGNNEDDGWCLNVGAAQANGQVTFEVRKAVDWLQAEERSRPNWAVLDQNHIVVCGAEGDSQPPSNVLCAIVNLDENQPNTKVVASKRVATKGNGYIYATPGVVRERTPTGEFTNRYVFQAVRVDVSNRNGKEKAPTNACFGVFQATLTGGIQEVSSLDCTVPGVGDQGHPQLAAAIVEGKWQVMPMYTSIIDSVGAGAIKRFSIDPATNKLKEEGSEQVPMAGGWTSQIYGENPATPQGRNHQSILVNVPNPGYGVAGGFLNTTQSLIIVPNTHRIYRGGNAANGLSEKMAFSLTVLGADQDPVVPPTPPGSEPSGGGGGGGGGNPANSGGAGAGGCAASGGPGSWLALGLVMLVGLRRRGRHGTLA